MVKLNLVEVVYDLDEFKKKADEEYSVHYLFYRKPDVSVSGFMYGMEAGVEVFAVAKKGHLLKCVLFKRVRWDSSELDGYKGSYDEKLYSWAADVHKELKEKVVEMFPDATPGKYEVVEV